MKRWIWILCSGWIITGANAQPADSAVSYKLKVPQPVKMNTIATNQHFQLVAPDNYTQHLGFFCRQEWKMEKATKIPIKIRVGTNEQCSFLEQKTAYKLPSPFLY